MIRESFSNDRLGLIAGKGIYPELILTEARKAGVREIFMACVEGETDPSLAGLADIVLWHRVGQLGKMLNFFKQYEVSHVIMAGQMTPQRLFDLRPDMKAIAVLAGLKKRNAESIFGAIGAELAKVGAKLLPSTTFLEDYVAREGHIAGPRESKRLLNDARFGWPLAKKVSELDIGQTVIVKQGTVLAVEGYDGTNSTIRRGGQLGKNSVTMVKVSKPNQDMRFDVPVIGPDTLRIAGASGVNGIICEAEKTLILGFDEVLQIAKSEKVTLMGMKTGNE
ncbi:MAG: UDP-2,3-diacylglucosamine diphosphatase LpxI [Verrucomicrobiota bacterium]